MSFGRANGRSPIRPTWVNSNDCFEYRSKQHGAYAFAHPAEGDPTFGRDPTDALYEGVRMRQWHGQQSVSGQDIGIGRHHPPYVCAVTSPHMFATALLVTVNSNPHAENGASTPCLLMPHRVLRGLEHDFELMRDAMDVVTRVVPPSTHSAPKKGEFKITKLVLDPWRLFEFSPAPNANANETHDAAHMDYALVAIDPKTLTDEIPREWLRSLEDAAVFGYHPARDAHNLLGVAPKRWLDPAFCAVGKNAVGINWRCGRVVRNERDASFGESVSQSERFSVGSGFESTFEGLPPAHSSAGGAVLACMTDESARAAGTRNSMAADTRFAAAVRPYATPLIGYGDWGVLVGVHRGAVFGNEGPNGEPILSDVLRITDIVADLARRRAALLETTVGPAIEASMSHEAMSRDGEASSPERIETTTREEASIAAPAAERRVSWLEGDETLEDAALRKRRQWVEGMTIKQ